VVQAGALPGRIEMRPNGGGGHNAGLMRPTVQASGPHLHGAVGSVRGEPVDTVQTIHYCIETVPSRGSGCLQVIRRVARMA